MKAIRLGLLASVIVTMSAACTSTGATPPLGTTTTTLMAGWEQHFTVEWAVAEQSPTTRKVAGYVYNRHGEHAIHVRMLAQAVDQSGTVTGQRIAFVPGGVGGAGGAYFEVPNLPMASTYRVSVWDYTWIQGPKN
jgi:hypothetical protein